MLATGGDLIIAVNKQPVRGFDALTSYLFTKTQVGQTVTLPFCGTANNKTFRLHLPLAHKHSQPLHPKLMACLQTHPIQRDDLRVVPYHNPFL